jgi:hypothetical protein
LRLAPTMHWALKELPPLYDPHPAARSSSFVSRTSSRPPNVSTAEAVR